MEGGTGLPEGFQLVTGQLAVAARVPPSLGERGRRGKEEEKREGMEKRERGWREREIKIKSGQKGGRGKREP